MTSTKIFKIETQKILEEYSVLHYLSTVGSLNVKNLANKTKLTEDCVENILSRLFAAELVECTNNGSLIHNITRKGFAQLNILFDKFCDLNKNRIDRRWRKIAEVAIPLISVIASATVAIISAIC